MNILFENFESFFGNISFLLSFFITIYYWVKLIFFPNFNSFSVGSLPVILLNLLLGVELGLRWFNSGHFPLSNLYESLIFLAWSILFLYIYLEKAFQNQFLGLLITPLILCILGFTEFSLPGELQISKPLVPALQSNWLFMHVTVMILSYAALLVGSLLALTYLVIYNYLPEKFRTQSIQTSSYVIDTNSQFDVVEPDLNFVKLQKFLIIFDNFSYRSIGIGFCCLTLGILSGAVWANETWGSYWSWDPKETWALITWLTFALYLHTRLLYNWQGVRSALIGSFGFLLVWICYLGVNLLGKGLHSYGFFS